MNQRLNKLRQWPLLRVLRGTHVKPGTSKIIASPSAFLKDERFATNMLLVGRAGCGKSYHIQNALPSIPARRPTLYLSLKDDNAADAFKSFQDINLTEPLDQVAAEKIRSGTRLKCVPFDIFNETLPPEKDKLLLQNVMSLLATWSAEGKNPLLIIDEPIALFGKDNFEQLLEALAVHKIYRSVNTVAILQEVLHTQNRALGLFNTIVLFPGYSGTVDINRNLARLGDDRWPLVEHSPWNGRVIVARRKVQINRDFFRITIRDDQPH